VTGLEWNENHLELEIVNPQHPTYAPFSANKCWALLPTNLDSYCYLVDTPGNYRILRRIGVYLKIGDKQGSLPQVLDKMETFYGANYLRLRGGLSEAKVEVRVFPDLSEHFLYFVTDVKNLTSSPIDVSVVIAVDFEFNPVRWGSLGFSENVATTVSKNNPSRAPQDDRIDVSQDGGVFLVSDARESGIAFISSKPPRSWTLDREKFDFAVPDIDIKGTNETESEDSFCVVRHVLSVQPFGSETLPVVAGYQKKEDQGLILEALDRFEQAFDQTKDFYRAPLIKGVKIHTPDPIINAQFRLYNIFVKMAEHRHGDKHVFLPAVHYHNWACPRDCFQAIQSYVFMNDLDILTDSIAIYRGMQYSNGRIPEGVPMWQESSDSEAARNTSPDIKNTNEYIIGVCKYIKFRRDKAYAKDIFPSLQKAAGAILACKIEGLITTGSNYGFDRADYPGGFGESPQVYTSAEAYKSLMDLSELSEWLGNKDYARELVHEAEALRETINRELWMEEKGYYRIGVPVGKVGHDERDKKLFYEEMLGIGNINVVEWGIANQDQALRVLQNVRGRLFTPYGIKFLDPPWIPSYTDHRGVTYEAGQVQQGGIWPLAINDLARAEIKTGHSETAFGYFRELGMDRLYSRFKMWENGKELSFLCPMEWVDTDLTLPVTSVLFLVTSSTWSETLLEHILGIKAGYEELKIKPSFPSSWNHAEISNLRVGESEWDITINGNGEVKETFVDGIKTDRIRIVPGKHRIIVNMA